MTTEKTSEGGGLFNVVVNDEEQYSIWPASRQIPAGWRRTGFQGPRPACLAHIETVWTDITPKSVRR
jgi:MbtH protein